MADECRLENVACTGVRPTAIEACQKRLPSARCSLVSPDETQLPFESQTFRLVLCFEVWPLIHQEWFLPEVSRVLELGGVFVAACCNRLSLRALIQVVRGHGDQYASTYLKWNCRLRKRSFEIVAVEGLGWIPFGRTSNSTWVPKAAEIERMLALHRLPALSPWSLIIARKA